MSGGKSMGFLGAYGIGNLFFLIRGNDPYPTGAAFSLTAATVV